MALTQNAEKVLLYLYFFYFMVFKINKCYKQATLIL